MYRLTEAGKKHQVGSFYRYRLILHLLGYRFLFSSVERLLRAGFMYQLGLAFPTFLICDWKKEKKILEKWYFFLKLGWPSVRKIFSCDRRKTFEIQAESPEFAKIFRSLENHLFEQWKVATIFKTECFFILFLEVSQTKYIRTIGIQLGKNNWDLETCRKS